jgi:lactate dehydrogenase-like 2-hydroxyacid dehydrogenase
LKKRDILNTLNNLNKISILDLEAIGLDLDLSLLNELGSVETFNTTTSNEILNRCIDSNIIITNKVLFGKEILKNLPNLKLICIAATGVNNVDLVTAKELGIEVMNVSGYSTKSVAQLTLTFALNFLNSIADLSSYTKSKKWVDSNTFTNLSFPISNIDGKSWGIIGLGTIGKEVAKSAEFFGASIKYYSTSGENRSNDYKQVGLEELLKTSDIISIHCPLNDRTANLLKLKELELLKENCILINVGRGGIINENDLSTILNYKKINIALDVLETEPMASNSPLISHLDKNNLIITPHIAWAGKESREKLFEGIVSNIKNFLNKS